MAEIASPASDPRFLRRHYPHQVQRVRLNDVSAKRLPRIFFLEQNKTQLWEINNYIRCAFRHNRGNPRAQCLQPNCQRETIPRLVPVSRSCERSPAILPCFSSRQSRRCKFRFGPCRRTCLRRPLCTSSHMYPGQQVSLCSH